MTNNDTIKKCKLLLSKNGDVSKVDTEFYSGNFVEFLKKLE
jgi:hypothetical protein